MAAAHQTPRCAESDSERAVTTDQQGPLDPQTAQAVYLQYQAEIQRFLVGVLRDHDLAAEATQATFTKLVEVGNTVDPETRRGWLFRVAFNQGMLIRRRQTAQRKSYNRLGWLAPRSADSPELNLHRQELAQCVQQAIAELPPEQREVIELRIYEEHTFAIIAEQLSLPLGTILSRMRLGLKKLSSKLQDQVGELES